MRKFTSLIVIFMTCFLINVLAQEREITGKVTSAEDGSTMPGVNVVVKGTFIGTTTGSDGTYKLKVPENAKVIVFSYLGKKTLEIALTESNVINAVLSPDILKLDEVVVTALGIKQEKKALGYAVQELSGDEISVSNQSNLVNSIGSKVAGVQVTSSTGAPGASAFIRIRGSRSFTGENQPLFVIDGIPIDNSQYFSGRPEDENNNLLYGVANSNRAIDINPDDIESMNVLKGPSATALYGLRAANGAVIITTKKGKLMPGKKVSVSYNTNVSFDQVNKLPELQNTFAQGTGGNYRGPETGASGSWGPKIDTLRYDGDKNYIWDKHGRIVGMSHPTATGTPVEAYDNLGTFFTTGVTYNNNLGIAGGTEAAMYYLNVGHLEQTGIIPNSSFRKTNVKITGETKLNEKFNTSGSINYIKSGGKRIQQGSNTSGLMLGLLRTTPTFDNSNGVSDPVDDPTAYVLSDGRQRTYRGGGGYDNPYWIVNRSPYKDDVNRMIGYVGFSYDPLKWLNVNYKLGADLYSDRRKQAFDIFSRTAPAGRVFEDQHFQRDMTSNLLLSATHQFNEDLEGKLILGNNLWQTYHEQLFTQGDGLNIPEFYHISNAQAVFSREAQDKKRTAANFFNAKASYKRMLYLDVTGRQEWSTTLPKDKNSFFYPSASLGFVFTEYLQMADNKYLPYGKVRISGSKVGNDAPIYATSVYYESTTYNDGWTDGVLFPYLGVSGFNRDAQLGSEDLKPETTENIEAGFDLRFLDNRIGVDFTYYKSITKDQIIAVPIAASSGFRTQVTNAGKIRNEGFELVLNATPVKYKGFSWDMVVNFSRNKNMVVELAEGIDNIILGGFEGSNIRVVPGERYGVIYGGAWLRDANGKRVIGPDGFPIVDPNEKVLGDPNPDWIAGIRNMFSYKGFTLSTMFDIRKGGDIWNGTRGALIFFGMAKETENRGDSIIFDGVKGEILADGTISITTTPNNVYATLDQSWYQDNGGGFGIQAEDFIEDGGWVRLKEITLSYSLPQRVVKKTPFAGIEFSVSGRNLWLDTDFTGVDPETSLMGSDNAQGLEYFNMPNTKSFGFGLKLNF